MLNGAFGPIRGRIRGDLAYLLAVVLTAATLLLRLALSSRFGDDPALELFLIPIILSAVAGGLGPGLVSTVLVALGTAYFFLPPKYSLAIASGLHSLEWLVLVLAGALMSVLLHKPSARSPRAVTGSFGNERPGISPDSESSVSRTILISAGSTCAALGAVSLVGWFFHIAALTRVGPAFNPMMPNTALGLFLDGLALLFLAAGRPKAALGGAVWSLLAGILTLAEFSFSIDLHIDELLVRDYIRAVPFPGRPAPNAALCLVFCGVVLLWASMPRWRDKAAVIIGMLGAVVFGLGAAAVSGYLVGLPMYAFGSSKPMAANAGLGFVAMGLGVMALAWRRSQPSPEAEARILFSAERKVRAGFALALAALILIGGMSYFSLVRLHKDRVWVEHTQQVIATLRLVLATITDAETGERGYVITGREEFLQFYQEAIKDVGADLGSLRRLTADNRMQQGRLDALAPLVAERLLLLQQTVELRRGRGFGAAQQHLASGRGEQIHDRIRGILAEMEATEQNLLRERAAEAQHAGTVAKTVIVAGITLAFVFVVVALFVISQDFSGSRRARAALQDARDQLETRVLQRTAELAKANEAALSSEARLAGIINSAMDAIITVDEQQRIVLFNPAAEKMFGCRAGDALGQSLDMFIPERFRSEHVQHHRTFSETGITQREMGRLGSLCGLRASGEEFPLEAAISRVDVQGQKLFTAILRDTTERMAAEEALRRQASLIDQIHDAVLVWEWDGPIISWNRGAERLYGYSPREALGTVSHDLLRTETTISVEGFLNILEQTKAWEGELQHVTRDGKKIIVETRMTLVEDKDQRYVLETDRDITERKRAEEALRESEARLRLSVQSANVGLWDWDLKTDTVYFSPEWRNQIGYADDEIPHRFEEWQSRMHPDDLERTLERVRAFIANPQGQHETEFRLRHKDGSYRWIYTQGDVLRDAAGKPLHMLGCHLDITERKRAEEEIRLLNRDLEQRVAERTAELQAAVQDLESFSYSVAHDLRAPLRAVDGFSEAVLEDYGPQLPEQGRNYLQTIRRGAQRMGALVDDLLAFSRLGRQPLTKQPVDMEALVRSALEELVPKRKERKVEIVNGDLPVAHGDPALLRQVWTNLLSNAIKYSRHTDQARIEIGALAEAQRNVYFVRDNGAGFDMKYADKLFGVFQRLHRADEFEGTGIGLAIVQRVVHRHGGQVWAEAQLNEGATFYFTLEGEE